METNEAAQTQEAEERREQEEAGASGKTPGGEPRSCEGCSRWIKVRRKMRIAELLGTAIEKLSSRFSENEFKPSVADYLKLVELEDTLEQNSDAVKEIKVTWVEPKESDTGR